MRQMHCAKVNISHVDQEVRLAGWVCHHRNHGGVIFIDLWDHTGIVQVVINPEHEQFSQAQDVRRESVIEIAGLVRKRPEGTANQELPTGEVEVVVTELVVHNISKVPPFSRDELPNVSEEIRYRYRYLDLRGEKMQKHLRFRSDFNHYIRVLHEESFVEVETPILTKGNPRSARRLYCAQSCSSWKMFCLTPIATDLQATFNGSGC